VLLGLQVSGRGPAQDHLPVLPVGHPPGPQPDSRGRALGDVGRSQAAAGGAWCPPLQVARSSRARTAPHPSGRSPCPARPQTAESRPPSSETGLGSDTRPELLSPCSAPDQCCSQLELVPEAHGVRVRGLLAPREPSKSELSGRRSTSASTWPGRPA
jgi:hypothetical protein